MRTRCWLSLLSVVLLHGCSTPGDQPNGDGGGDDDHDAASGPDATDDFDGSVDEDVDADIDETPTEDGGPPPDATPGIDAGPAPDASPIDAGPPQDLTVCASGGDYATIHAAVVAANPGSTINICPGTYNERIEIINKPLTLIGTGGAAQTVIDGGMAGTVITIRDVAAGVALHGLTVQHGQATIDGGGIRCENSALTIATTTVLANIAPSGGGLYANTCTLDIRDSRFEGNQGGAMGGGALMVFSSGAIDVSTFTMNYAIHGGGIANIEGNVAITRNNLVANLAGTRGGALFHQSDAPVSNNFVADNVSNLTGGGIHTVTHAPLISGNTVTRNVSENDGGGIYIHQGTPTLRMNHFDANTSHDDGGGIRCFESGCTLDTNLIENNHADDSGGGIRVSHVPGVLLNNIVRDNFAGGIGGGMDLDNDASLVRGGEVVHNRAGGSGGGISGSLAPWTGLVLDGIRIADNRAWQGAGIYLFDNFTPVTMKNLTIVNNSSGRGGALMVRATNFTLSHSLLAANEANEQGGAIYGREPNPWLEPCSPSPCPPANPVGVVKFTVIADNVVETPGGGGAVWSSFAGLRIENSIVFQNGADPIVGGEIEDAMMPGVTYPPAVSYSDIFPAAAGLYETGGNISVDPQFVDHAAGDYHLATGSACVDAGDPQLSDADGSRADMGMYGGTP